MTALLLFRADRFDGGIVLENLAYDIALSIREAQTYGLNVRESTPGQFTYAYGTQFHTSNATEYQFYVDTNQNDAYNSGESIRKYTLKRGARITGVCTGVDENNCTNTAPPLNIQFLRPQPKAIINGGANYGQITITARDGSTKMVGVRKTGQIFIK